MYNLIFDPITMTLMHEWELTNDHIEYLQNLKNQPKEYQIQTEYEKDSRLISDLIEMNLIEEIDERWFRTFQLNQFGQMLLDEYQKAKG